MSVQGAATAAPSVSPPVGDIPNLPHRAARSTKGRASSPMDCRSSSRQTRFYFVIFPCNNAPVFHSNRIPIAVLRGQEGANTLTTETVPVSSAPHEAIDHSREGTTHRCRFPQVGDFKDDNTVMEEVPQETLQKLAFPTAFGMRSGVPALHRREPDSRRYVAFRDCLSDSVATPEVSGTNTDGNGGPRGASPSAATSLSDSGAPLYLPDLVTPEGPPWKLCLEEVRTANGDLRYCRIIATACFTVMITSHTGPMHTMQTRYAAASLIVACPPSSTHYTFLLSHVDVLRGMLYCTMDFGMSTMQRFFSLLATRHAGRGGSQHSILKRISAQLERHHEALETYYTLKAMLTNALEITSPLPPLSSRSVEVPMETVLEGMPVQAKSAPIAVAPSRQHRSSSELEGMLFGNSPARLCSRLSSHRCGCRDVSDLLSEALTAIKEFSERFTSALVCGFLSISNLERYDFWQSTLDSPRCSGDTAELAGGHMSHPRGDMSVTPGKDSSHRNGGLAEADRYAMYWEKMAQHERGSSTPVVPFTERMQPSSGNCLKIPEATQERHTSALERQDTFESLQDTAVSSTAIHSSAMNGSGAPRGATKCDGYHLSERRVGRVVLFCTDQVMAMHIMVVAAFFFRTTSATMPVYIPSTGCEHTRATNPSSEWGTGGDSLPSRLAYAHAFCARVPSCAHANVPVQWVREEYSEGRLKDLYSPYTADNVVLVVAPRALLCRRLFLSKRLDSTTIIMEQFTEGDGGSRSFAKQFHCFFCRQEDMLPNPTVTALLAEALALHRSSKGLIGCAAVLEDMMTWLVHHNHTAQRVNEKVGVGPQPTESGMASITTQPRGERPHHTSASSLYGLRRWAGSVSSLQYPSRGHSPLPTISSPTSSAAQASSPDDVLLPGSYGPLSHFSGLLVPTSTQTRRSQSARTPSALGCLQGSGLRRVAPIEPIQDSFTQESQLRRLLFECPS